jgi:hypothetical protein
MTELAIPEVHDPTLSRAQARQHLGDLRLRAKAVDALAARAEVYAELPEQDRSDRVHEALPLPIPIYIQLRRELIRSGAITRTTVPHWKANEWSDWGPHR